MSLNIKNARVHDLARRAAEVTGKSQTAAIQEALERLLEAHDADPRAVDLAWRRDRLIVLGHQYSERPATEGGIHEVEDLYDPTTGLPA